MGEKQKLIVQINDLSSDQDTSEIKQVNFCVCVCGGEVVAWHRALRSHRNPGYWCTMNKNWKYWKHYWIPGKPVPTYSTCFRKNCRCWKSTPAFLSTNLFNLPLYLKPLCPSNIHVNLFCNLSNLITFSYSVTIRIIHYTSSAVSLKLCTRLRSNFCNQCHDPSRQTLGHSPISTCVPIFRELCTCTTSSFCSTPLPRSRHVEVLM